MAQTIPSLQSFPSFRVLAQDASVADSAQLVGPGQWLVIYVGPNCPSCDRLLQAMASWQMLEAPRHTVVIVSAAPDVARSYLARFVTPASAVTWYADPDGTAWHGLQLDAVPAVVGCRGSSIAWRISGVLNSPVAVEPAIRAWMGR